MNHIAHFLLAPHTVEGATGTLLADFQRGAIPAELPADIRAAIRLHRSIDSHTDRHAVTAAARALFAPGLRRYAGIALDLYFDHCLVRNWAAHGQQSFPSFVADTYERLGTGVDAGYVPSRMRRMAAAMRSDDWLGAYATPDGVLAALHRLNYAIDRRFGREVDLVPLFGELRRLGPDLDDAFDTLFPALSAFAAAPYGNHANPVSAPQ